MNAEDKAEYHNSLVKNITRKCHQKCFKQNEIKLDKQCITGCYHKYINVMSKIRKKTLLDGDKLDSQFVLTVFSTREDPVLNLMWAKGGSKYMLGLPVNWVLKYNLFNQITPYKGFSPFRDKYENQ